MKRRGQAATEFLMTYGWAILIVLLAIGALAYFDILSPNKFLPSSCILFPGLSCDDFIVSPGSAIVIITNGMGNSLTINELNLTNSNDDSSCQVDNVAGDILSDGESKVYVFSGCNNGNPDGRFKGEINIDYTANQLSHKRIGEIVSLVEGVVNPPTGTSFTIYPSGVHEEDGFPSWIDPDELKYDDENYLTVYDDRAATSGAYFPDRTYFEFPDLGLMTPPISATLRISHQENINSGDTFNLTSEYNRREVTCWTGSSWENVTSPYTPSELAFGEINEPLPDNCRNNINNMQLIVTYDPTPNTGSSQYFDLVELTINL